MPTLSPFILSVLSPFSILFSRKVWNHALTLIVGSILCSGKRTVCAVLRIMGLEQEISFAKYHHVLNRVNWLPLRASKIILDMILPLMGKDKPLVLFGDETLERRKGRKIKAKGYYRDAVRSSRKMVVKTSGLKWLTLAASWRFPFSDRHFALPFLSVLEPSEKSDKAAKKRHKTTIEWTIQVLKQVARWVGSRSIIFVGDGGFACSRLAWACLKYKISLISRLKMNARLYDFAPPDIPGKRGRKVKRGRQLVSFKEMIEMKDLGWKEAQIEGYAKKKKTLKYISTTSLWGMDCLGSVPIRWVLVIDPAGELDPIPLMTTDITLSSERIIELFIQRWNLEVTFEEVREHLGVETQRQWSDKAVARTTPVLMALYTLVCLIANRMHEIRPIEVAQTAWYQKNDATFSDLLKSIRRALWSDILIFRKVNFDPFKEKNKLTDTFIETDDKNYIENIWIRTLIEHLAAA